MINRKTARWLTIAGALAAVLSGLGSLLIAFLPSFNPLGFGEALLILGLAVGIFLNNRACAVAALLFFAVMRFEMYSDAAAAQALQGGSVMVGFILSALFFTFLYALGVVGTFATASLPPAEPRTAQESSTAAVSRAAEKKKTRVKAESARGLCGACNGLGQLPETKLPCAWCDGKGYV
jgi:hypothetical protein